MNMNEIAEEPVAGTDSDGCFVELDDKANRKCYLITYSKADKNKFPTRQSFADATLEAFSMTKSKKAAVHWVCSEEHHKDSGVHYHIAIKFSGNRRWLSAKRFLLERYGISVHFSDQKHYNYYSAYRYVVKEDKAALLSKALLSKGHPDLSLGASPKTSKPTKALMKRRRSQQQCNSDAQSGTSQGAKRRRLSNLAVAEALPEKEIKNSQELLALANTQREEGRLELANFVLGRSAKALSELIATTLKMHGASASIAKAKMSQMEMVKEEAAKECKSSCNGLWFECAVEVLHNNKVNKYVFADAMCNLLEKGRGKFRNIMITGPANCGKTFLLNPLNDLFETFTNPANTSYAWLGAEKAQVILLNDFLYSTEIMAWNDFLCFLEGQTVHLAAPKSTYAQGILFDEDTPIFATGK